MLKIYTLKQCSTCKNALKWLDANNIPYEVHAVRETPPSVSEITAMRDAIGSIKKLYNTSGQDYRALGLKDTLPDLPPADAIQLLASNGSLVKRPFAIDEASSVFLTGFREPQWEAAFQISKS